MIKRNRGVRVVLASLLFTAAMGFGAFQVVAGNGSAPAQSESCDAFACRTECAEFGGDLIEVRSLEPFAGHVAQGGLDVFERRTGLLGRVLQFGEIAHR